MKTTKLISTLLVILLTAQAALAWYDPSTQRWLTRDPIGEPGFQMLQTANAMPQVRTPALLSPDRWIQRDPIAGQVDGNLYRYVANNPIEKTDFLGLCDNDTNNKCAQKSKQKYALEMSHCLIGYWLWVFQYDEVAPVFGIGFASMNFRLCTDRALDNLDKCGKNCIK